MTNERPPGEPRKPGFLHTLSAVLWGMLGLRRGKSHRELDAHFNPVHIIIVGLLVVAVFVVVLILIARSVA